MGVAGQQQHPHRARQHSAPTAPLSTATTTPALTSAHPTLAGAHFDQARRRPPRPILPVSTLTPVPRSCRLLCLRRTTAAVELLRPRSGLASVLMCRGQMVVVVLLPVVQVAVVDEGLVCMLPTTMTVTMRVYLARGLRMTSTMSTVTAPVAATAGDQLTKTKTTTTIPPMRVGD